MLDLGSGTDVVAGALARLLLAGAAVSASDLSPAAVELTRRNAERKDVAIECRYGLTARTVTGSGGTMIPPEFSGWPA